MKAKGPIHASPGDCVLSCLRRDFHWVTFLGCNKAEESVYKPFWFSYLFVFYKLILLLSGLAPRTGHHFLYLNKTKPPDSYLTEMGENGRPPLKWLEVKRVGNHTHTHTHTHTQHTISIVLYEVRKLYVHHCLLPDMELGPLLARSGHTHLAVYLMVSPYTSCLLACSFFSFLHNLLRDILSLDVLYSRTLSKTGVITSMWEGTKRQLHV
jgi:hypothetical protein